MSLSITRRAIECAPSERSDAELPVAAEAPLRGPEPGRQASDRPTDSSLSPFLALTTMTRTDTQTSGRPLPLVLWIMLLGPVIICASLYGYYFFAQRIINPVPVAGVLKSVSCQGGSISQQGAKTSIVYLHKIYGFPSRSRTPGVAAASGPRQDEISEYIEYDRSSDCESAALSQKIGSQRTVWAGENEMSDRFRGRFTAEQAYPPLALLLVPGCIAALVLWAWRRASR